MSKVTPQEKIAKAQAALKIAEARLEALELKEANRILGIARRIGFYKTTVSDDVLERALRQAMADADTTGSA